MPAAVDLSFERFLIKRDPLQDPPLASGAKPEPLQHTLMASVDYDDSEVDQLRDGPLISSSSSRPHPRLNTRAPRHTSPRLKRTLDEDYDAIDGLSDVDPQSPQSAVSDGASMSSFSPRNEIYDEDAESKMEYDAGYDSATSEDPPLVSSERAPPRTPQEQPSIATIEDEQGPATFSGTSGGADSASTSTLPAQQTKPRAKTRVKCNHQLQFIMTCLIDDCVHPSLTPKEREKHMDTHFHKRWQCGSCKKFYATSYTLKRHSDSTKIPEACKGAYEANNFTKSGPYWKMPEYADRVRMPGPDDYLLSEMLEVFKERDELLAKDGLKRPLPMEVKSTADAPAPKRARKSVPRRKESDSAQPVQVKTEVTLTGFAALDRARPTSLEMAAATAHASSSSEAGPSRSPDTVSSAGSSGMRSPSPSPETPITPDVLMAEAETPAALKEATAFESDRESARTLVHSRAPAKIEGRTAQHICLQLWVLDHPAANREEFDRYWAELGQEERDAYEVLAKSRQH